MFVKAHLRSVKTCPCSSESDAQSFLKGVCERDGKLVVSQCVRQAEEETQAGCEQGLEETEGGTAHEETKEEEKQQQQPSHATQLEAEEAKKKGGAFQELALIGWEEEEEEEEDKQIFWQRWLEEGVCIQASSDETEGRE